MTIQPATTLTHSSKKLALLERLERALSQLPDAPPSERDMNAARDARRAELLTSSCLPDRQWNRDAQPMAGWSFAMAQTRDIMVNPDGSIVALVGNRGAGKTQIAVEIARSRINALRSVLYACERDMLAEIRSTYNRGTDLTEKDAIRSFASPSLLIIDELKPRTTEDAWAAQMLEHIVDARYASHKHTILISNMDPDAFARHAGESINSRINETGGVINCQWEGFR